jgi:tRNA/rRNA methyltransferase
MGLRDLALVRPPSRTRQRAAAMAVHAHDVLERARIVPGIAEAVADCRLVVGTTCRAGPYRAHAAGAESLAPLILEHAAAGSVAIVFGPEDHGLSNDDLKACQRLLRIDASADYPSLNLAQAVLLCCYELRRAAGVVPRRRRAVPLASAARTEFLFARLQAALLRIGFLNPQNPDHIMFALRRLIGRAGLEVPELRILLGLTRQIEWFGGPSARRGNGGEEARS